MAMYDYGSFGFSYNEMCLLLLVFLLVTILDIYILYIYNLWLINLVYFREMPSNKYSILTTLVRFSYLCQHGE